jgi:GntP family gluconate:H+ symporter
MSDMPLFQTLVFFAAVIVLVVATAPRKFHPFLALVAVATAFGFTVGFSTGFVGKAFGAGFSQAIYSPGLAIVAAALVGGLAETTAASNQVMATIERWRSRLGITRLPALLGLIAGMGASPATAFAVLTPLLRPLSGANPQQRGPVVVALALGISASHGLVLLAPVPIAAASILDAEWNRVALFGLPLALLLVGFGAILARTLSVAAAASPPLQAPSIDAPRIVVPKPSGGGSAAVLLLATAIPLLMLIEQSIGDMPSEPLGGGPARELVIGIGRPLPLFLVGIGIMSLGLWRQGFGLITDSTWIGRILGNVAGILLIVGAAGGLQKLCQETGMAELLGERLVGRHLLSWSGGVLVPFLIAAVIKTLQGSSLVAAITAAGIVQPILLPLGLGDGNGKALATLAIGIGAVTISHVNDEFFWLVADGAGLPPLRGLAAFSLGTLLQGFAGVAALLLLSALIHVI